MVPALGAGDRGFDSRLRNQTSNRRSIMKQQGLGDYMMGSFVVPQNPLTSVVGQGIQQNIMNGFNQHTLYANSTKRCAYCRSVRSEHANCKNCGASETT